jgi:hypothetical protein
MDENETTEQMKQMKKLCKNVSVSDIRKDAQKEKTMTVKEVADVLGYKADTIQGKVKELFPEIVKNGVTTLINQEQVTIIKQNLVPRNLGLKSEVESATTELEIQQKIAEGYKLAVELADRYRQRAEIAEKDKEKLQIELDENKDWYSVKRVQLMGFLTDKDSRKLWRPLRKYCINNNLRIQKIFDANYGDVYTYPSKTWKEVYGIDLNNRKSVLLSEDK